MPQFIDLLCSLRARFVLHHLQPLIRIPKNRTKALHDLTQLTGASRLVQARQGLVQKCNGCLLYTSDAADE